MSDWPLICLEFAQNPTSRDIPCAVPFENLNRFAKLTGTVRSSMLVYGGSQRQTRGCGSGRKNLFPLASICRLHRLMAMVDTKLFKNGGNQAVRIPRRWAFEGDTVTMIRQGDALIIRPKKDDWSEVEDLAAEFDSDFMAGGTEDPEADESVNFE